MSSLELIGRMAVLAQAGGGPAISAGLVGQAATETGTAGSFAALQANPEHYQGKPVILGAK